MFGVDFLWRVVCRRKCWTMGFGGAKNAWKACADTLRTLEQFMLVWLMRTMFNGPELASSVPGKILDIIAMNAATSPPAPPGEHPPQRHAWRILLVCTRRDPFPRELSYCFGVFLTPTTGCSVWALGSGEDGVLPNPFQTWCRLGWS